MKYFSLLLFASLLMGLSGVQADSPGSRVLLLGSENVRKELKLTRSQGHALDSLRRSYREQARSFVKKNDPNSAAMLEALTSAYDKRVLSILTPEQGRKLEQIEHRVLGAWLVTAPSVQTLLNLSKRQMDQVKRIQERMEEYTKKINREAAAGKLTHSQRLGKLRDYRLRLTRDLERVLTSNQRQTLQSLEHAEAAAG